MNKILLIFLCFFPYTAIAQGGFYQCDFSDTVENNQWNLNGRWTIGAGNYLYVSSATPSDVVYYYDPVYSGGTIYNHSDRAYKETYLNAGPAIISFNWKARHVQHINRFLVLLVPYDSSFIIPDNLSAELSLPQGSIQITNSTTGLAVSSSSTGWSTYSKTVTIPATRRYKLWFVWNQQFISWDNPVNPYLNYGWMAAIDDVSIINTESFVSGFEEDENLSKWQFVDAGTMEKWNVGNETYCGGEKALYISNNGGLTNNYTNSLSSFAYAYRRVVLRAGNWHISYDWKSNGEVNGDYMRVFLMPDTQSLSSIGMNLSMMPPNALLLDSNQSLCGQSEWRHFSDSLNIMSGGLQFYKLVFYWVNNGNGIGTSPPAAIDNVALNAKKKLEITVSNPYQCSVFGGGVYDYMSNVNVQIIPNPHHHVTRIRSYKNDALLTPLHYVSTTKDTCTVIMDDNYKLIVDVAIDSHLVTVSSRNNYGNVSVTNNGLIPYGQVCTVSADTINTNYKFYIWSNGVTSNPYTFVVTQDTNLTAIYINPDECHILQGLPSNVIMGQVNINGDCIYQDLYQEGNVILTATANYGYHFVQWSDGVTTNPRTINLTQDTSVIALFAINQYNLTLLSNDVTLGATSGSGSYDYLTQVSISAIPSPHCHFVQWDDGNTTNPRLVTVTSDISYTAIFAQDAQYTINVMVNDQSCGSATGGGVYYAGEYVTLSATPNEHYYFSTWNNGMTANPYYLTVIENASYTAIFEPIDYTVNLTTNDDYMGSVYGSGSYPYGSTANIEAQPFDGFRFIEWSDGNTNSRRTLTVMEDISLQAHFGDAGTTGINDAIKTQISIQVHQGRIIVEGAENCIVQVYDIIGRQHPIEEKLPRGVYMVHIEKVGTRKVVIM